jgi:signal transduction histidine kinase
MRAPLRAMQSFAKILSEEYSDRLGAQGTEYLDRITGAASRMDKLILDVLHYSRVARADIELGPVDFQKLIHGTIDHYPAFQMPRANILLKPPFPTVLANEAALTQCITNLISNAVKFVKPGEQPRLEIWAQPQGEFVRIFFKDNGVGIEPEFHERIFGMFQRLSTKYEGTGLGLSIVRKAAERMGGKVGLESSPGQGSVFWLQLRPAEKK